MTVTAGLVEQAVVEYVQTVPARRMPAGHMAGFRFCEAQRQLADGLLSRMTPTEAPYTALDATLSLASTSDW